MTTILGLSRRGGAYARALVVFVTVLSALCLLSACGDAQTDGQSTNICAALASSVTASTGATGHLVYQRVAMGPLPTQTTWQPGQTLRFQWCVAPTSPTHDVGDAQEALTLTLYGPYATSAAAQAAVSQPENLPPPLTNSQPITTDTWSATMLTSTLQLPTSLVPGYYIVVAGVTLGNTTGQGSNGAIAPTSQQTQVIQVAS